MPVLDQFSVGGTLSYTRGQFKDASGSWRELNAFQISPIKGTLFGEWNDDKGNSLRVQMLAVKGTDKAYEDSSLPNMMKMFAPMRQLKSRGMQSWM